MTSDRSPIQLYGPLAGGAMSLLVGVLCLLWVTAPVAGWGATALVLFGLWGLGTGLGELSPRVLARFERVPEVWRGRAAASIPYALTALVVAFATWPAVVGEVPMSQDHAHHYLQTAIFTDDLLASGHLFGWTHRIAAGLPFGDVYATGVYVFTGFFRIVTFGLVSRATSYALGIYLVWLVPTWAIVAWTRRLLHEVVDARWIATIACVFAASLFALDVGTDREGGWVYSMFHAVWPQIAGTGMWLWGTLAMVRFVERPTTRRLGVASVVAGFAFWAHPMNALNMLITAPILFVVCLATYRRTAVEDSEDDTQPVAPHTAAWWLVPAFGLAGIVGFAWISHMMGANDLMSSFTAYGETLREYALRVLTSGTPFAGSTALAAIAALFGLLLALVRGGVSRHFVAVGLVVFVVLASSDPFASSDFGLSEAAPYIMFKRFIITAKPLMFALAGLGLGAAIQFALNGRSRPGKLAILLTLLTVSPFVYAGMEALPEVMRTPSARFLTATDVGVEESLGKIVNIIDRELDSTPGPKRVVVWHDRGDSGDYALFAIAELGVGYLPTRNPPAHGYAELGRPTDLENVSLLGASHIIARSDRKFPGAKKLGEYPPYHLWRINNTPGDGVRVFRSNAGVRTVEWSPMRQIAEIRNSKGKGELVFAIPPHPKWTYSQNGRQLKTKDYRYGRETTLTQVLDFEDGEVVAEYHDTFTERLAFVLMLLVLLLSIAGFIWNRDLPHIPRSWRERAPVVAMVASLVLFAALALVARQVGQSALDEAWAKSPGDVVLEALHRQKPEMSYEPKPFCVRPMSRNPRVGCDDSQLEPRLRLSNARNQRTPACVELQVPDGGHLDLKWDLPAGTKRVKGRFDGRMGGVVPIIEEDGKERSIRGSLLDLNVDGDTLEIRLKNQNRRVQEICLELVAIGETN